jgi:hypothetical protein
MHVLQPLPTQHHLHMCAAGTCTRGCARPTPWIFQHAAERFLPPYFFGTSRPVISSVSAKRMRYGATLTARYTGRVTGAVIMTPGAVTHQVRDSIACVSRFWLC